VLPDSLEQQFVVDVVEQAFYVEFQYPIILPAALSRDAHGVQGRLSRPVAVRIWKEDRIQIRFNQLLGRIQRQGGRHAGDSIRAATKLDQKESQIAVKRRQKGAPISLGPHILGRAW
jgi:hypothetical protein